MSAFLVHVQKTLFRPSPPNFLILESSKISLSLGEKGYDRDFQFTAKRFSGTYSLHFDEF